LSTAFRTFVVVNPNSSNGKTGKLWPVLRVLIRDRVGPFESALTTCSGEATEIARDALRRGFEMVVSLGGDGTHSECVNGFFDDRGPVNPDAVLGLATSGTGGDFRRAFDFARGPVAAIERLGGRETRPIDVGRFTYSDEAGRAARACFANILSFGISGIVDDMVNHTTKAFGGRVSFFVATLRALARYRPARIEISLDGGPRRETTIHNLAIANGKFFGGGMMVAPQALQDDGLFDIVGFEEMSTVQFVGLAGSIYKGKHLEKKHVTFARAAHLVVTSRDPVLLDVDGEQKGRLPITVDVLPKAIRLKV
jgi:YegS/Rv2252/BmrU family lipid kinase